MLGKRIIIASILLSLLSACRTSKSGELSETSKVIKPPVVKKIEKTDNKFNRLMLLTIKHYTSNGLATIKTLLDKGADVNAKDEDGIPALILAVESGQIEVVKFLLEAGADMDATNKKGQTASNIANKLGHKDMLDLFDSARIKYYNNKFKSAIVIQ